MDSIINKITPLSFHESVSLQTILENVLGDQTGDASLNEAPAAFSPQDEFQQLQENNVIGLETKRNQAEKVQRKRKLSDILKKRVKDSEKEKVKMRTQIEEMRSKQEEMYKYIKHLERKVQNIEWDVEGTKQDFRKDIKDLQGKVQTSEWGLEDLNRSVRNINDEVERQGAQIEGLDSEVTRLVQMEDA